jgi:hypothetical protein
MTSILTTSRPQPTDPPCKSACRMSSHASARGSQRLPHRRSSVLVHADPEDGQQAVAARPDHRVSGVISRHPTARSGVWTKARRSSYETGIAASMGSVAVPVRPDTIQNPAPANNNPTTIDKPPAMRSR